MIVDSPAIVAILNDEPDSKVFTDALERSSDARISAANLFEAAIVIDRARDPILSRRFDELIQHALFL